jgi:hypothetical protein
MKTLALGMGRSATSISLLAAMKLVSLSTLCRDRQVTRQT